MRPREPTVFVVDDDPAMRNSLRWLIESTGLPVKTAASAAEFLRSYEDVPGCLVLDVRMPGMSGLELQAELAARRVSLPILVITAYAEIPLVVRAMKAGAFDFIEKPFSDQMLLDRIRKAIDADADARRVRDEHEAVKRRFAQLTARERAIMEAVVAGKSNKMIAYELELNIKTIEHHRSRVMQKMQAKSLADLIRFSLIASEPC